MQEKDLGGRKRNGTRSRGSPVMAGGGKTVLDQGEKIRKAVVVEFSTRLLGGGIRGGDGVSGIRLIFLRQKRIKSSFGTEKDLEDHEPALGCCVSTCWVTKKGTI